MTAYYGLLVKVLFGISYPLPKNGLMLRTFMHFHRNHTNITGHSELALPLTAPHQGKQDELFFRNKFLCGMTHITVRNSQKVQTATDSLRVMWSTRDTRPDMGVEGQVSGLGAAWLLKA